MNLELQKIKGIEKLAGDGLISPIWARLSKDQESWRKSLDLADRLNQQLKDLGRVDDSVRRIADSIQSPLIKLSKQLHEAANPNTKLSQVCSQIAAAQTAHQESVRKMLDPLAGIREQMIVDETIQKIVKDLAVFKSPTEGIFKDILSASTAATAWTKQFEEGQTQTRKLLEGLTGSQSVQRFFKDFEQINQQWVVPEQLLSVSGALKDLQEQLQLSAINLPSIDWASAGTLARLLGTEGIADQLKRLGIESDGTFADQTETTKEAGSSWGRPDPWTILSLVLTLMIFWYQEQSNSQQQAKNEAFQQDTTKRLIAQSQQIQTLTLLLQQALVQAAQTPEERFVVRERIALVRSKPEHGSGVEGKLMPHEVVRLIDRKGKWIEVEYYHWLHQEHRTGWVLKKYLERVPANHAKNLDAEDIQ